MKPRLRRQRVLYVIDVKWINLFLTAVQEFQNSSVSAVVIPSIDNSDLTVTTNSTDNENAVLRSDLNINEHYYLLPAEAWNAFCGWYGCTGPEIARLLYVKVQQNEGENISGQCTQLLFSAIFSFVCLLTFLCFQVLP